MLRAVVGDRTIFDEYFSSELLRDSDVIMKWKSSDICLALYGFFRMTLIRRRREAGRPLSRLLSKHKRLSQKHSAADVWLSGECR